MNEGMAFCCEIHIRPTDHELINMQKMVWYLFRVCSTWCYLFQADYLNLSQTRSNNELMTLVEPSQLPRSIKVFIFISLNRYTRRYVWILEGSTTKDTICSTCVIYSLKLVQQMYENNYFSNIFDSNQYYFHRTDPPAYHKL